MRQHHGKPRLLSVLFSLTLAGLITTSPALSSATTSVELTLLYDNLEDILDRAAAQVDPIQAAQLYIEALRAIPAEYLLSHITIHILASLINRLREIGDDGRHRTFGNAKRSDSPKDTAPDASQPTPDGPISAPDTSSTALKEDKDEVNPTGPDLEPCGCCSISTIPTCNEKKTHPLLGIGVVSFATGTLLVVSHNWDSNPFRTARTSADRHLRIDPRRHTRLSDIQLGTGSLVMAAGLSLALIAFFKMRKHRLWPARPGIGTSFSPARVGLRFSAQF